VSYFSDRRNLDVSQIEAPNSITTKRVRGTHTYIATGQLLGGRGAGGARGGGGGWYIHGRHRFFAGGVKLVDPIFQKKKKIKFFFQKNGMSSIGGLGRIFETAFPDW
jgi:hypothetical protein